MVPPKPARQGLMYWTLGRDAVGPVSRRPGRLDTSQQSNGTSVALAALQCLRVNDVEDQSWSIPSNDGWQEISFRHLRHFKAEDADLVLASVHVRGQFWDRTQNPENLVPDHETILQQVILSRASLETLKVNLGQWRADYQAFEVILAEQPGQRLTLNIGQEPDIISSPTKPVCRMVYASGRANGEWSMVVDQSCLGIAWNQLAGALRFRK